MGLFSKGTIIGLTVVKIASVTMAATLLIGSSYVLWDMNHTERSAFLSEDMAKYRPAVEKGEPATLEELEEVNEDARAWLTIYETNINFPVVQGKDDLEYVNKDVNGQTSPTGSIYLAAGNRKDFSDSYNIMYGHHVDNGGMFGDVTKFLDSGYFNSHKSGILITDGQVYDLKPFAVMQTDAYDSMVYTPRHSGLGGVLGYIKSNSEHYRGVGNISKILVLSTCDDRYTNGRTLLFCKMTPHSGEYTQTIDDTRPPLIVHKNNYWALLNLLCTLLTIYLAIPLHLFLSKFRRKGDMEERNEMDEFYETDRFGSRTLIGSIIELFLSIVSLLLFILTENMNAPIQMIDAWTPVMLLLLVVTFIVDVYLFRYREKDDAESSE